MMPKTILSIRVPQEVANRLELESRKQMRTRSNLAAKLIAEALGVDAADVGRIDPAAKPKQS